MSSSVIWRRRILLMGIVALLVAIPVTILVRDSDDQDRARSKPRSAVAQLRLNPAVGDSEIQAVYRVPQGWELNRKDEVVRLSSADELVQVGITSPGPAQDSQQLLEQAIAGIEANYDDVEVSPGSGKEVGGLPARGAVVAARAEDTDLRILVAVTEGKERAYLIEVFTSPAAPPKRLVEAQRFLDSLELEG